VGSAAFLSGTTRLTVTVVAIIIESTNGSMLPISLSHTLLLISTFFLLLRSTEFVHILPLIFACLIAKWVGDLLTVSLIEVHTRAAMLRNNCFVVAFVTCLVCDR
jgi:H+/Cl- antiporter ClcA